jgi:hypothetical protein
VGFLEGESKDEDLGLRVRFIRGVPDDFGSSTDGFKFFLGLGAGLEEEAASACSFFKLLSAAL